MTPPAEVSSDRPLDATLEILARLVAFDTVSSRSNLELIEYVAAFLRDRSIESHVVPSADGRKAGLWARIGPPVARGVILAGHTDVVPVEGQVWQTDPFLTSVREGKVYGRGTADMKGFIACVLASVHHFRSASLSRPLHLALTFDEEIGCLGAPLLITNAAPEARAAEAVFIGEPTSMRVVAAHKGLKLCRTRVRGVEAHSSLTHLGVSAVEIAAQAISRLKALESELHGQSHPLFNPPHSTLTINRIEGGTATNILAGECWFDWDMRCVDSADAELLYQRAEAEIAQVVQSARQTQSGLAASTTILADAPALARERAGRAETLAARLLDDSIDPAAGGASFVAEAGLFQQAGLSAVLLGPGSIEQAHKPDEFVALDDLNACTRFLDRLRQHLL